MKYLRSKRGLIAFGAVAAVVGVTLFVLPAFGSNPGDYVSPPSGAGVLPIDVQVGGTGDCQNLFTNLNSVSEYDNVNPKTTNNPVSSGNGDGITFSLTLHGNNKMQEFDLSSNGAVILGIGIKGGTQSTAYDYRTGVAAGFLSSDTNLHAPAQTWTGSGTFGNPEVPTQLYSLSQLTICYRTGVSATGSVFQDSNHNGTKDGAESGLTRTVDLYQGGSLLSSTPAAGGTYTFSGLKPGATYTACVVSGAFTETVPTGTTTCTGIGEAPSGQTFTANALSTTIPSFGLAAVTSIAGKAFNDVNGNGTQDTGDTPLGGLTVTATDTSASGYSPPTTVTAAADGSYSFSGLYAGDNYTVCIGSPGANYQQSLPTLGYSCPGTVTGYSISNLGSGGKSDASFGFQPLGSISGAVFDDLNQDGLNNDSSPQGWTITLYGGASPATTTSTGGKYSFSALHPGTQYTVCETAPNGTTWLQSLPNPSAPNLCTGANELPKGFTFTPQVGSLSGTGDFGNVAADACTGSNGPLNPLGPLNYEIGTCKPGDIYAFNSSTLPADAPKYPGAPYVTYGVGGPRTDRVPTVERLTVPDPYGTDLQPVYKSILYTNSSTFPFDSTSFISSLTLMPYCNFDPRTSSADGFTLEPAYTDKNNAGAVIPGSDTACVIAITTSAPSVSGGTGTLTAWVYALDDAGRMGF